MRHQTKYLMVAVWALSVMVAAAQNDEGQKKTYFQNLFLDPEGHICYTEALDENPMNRLEYRTDGREIVGILSSKGDHRTKIEITDFDSDGKPDLIYIEKDQGEHDITKINFFRGPKYQEHLTRHFGHAMMTATHPLIKDEPVEKKRAAEIQRGLDMLAGIHLTDDDMGVYSAEELFRVVPHKDIRLAFVAADTLSAALKTIVEGDFRVLSQEPEIVKRYSLEIGILMGIDPSAILTEKPQ